MFYFTVYPQSVKRRLLCRCPTEVIEVICLFPVEVFARVNGLTERVSIPWQNHRHTPSIQDYVLGRNVCIYCDFIVGIVSFVVSKDCTDRWYVAAVKPPLPPDPSFQTK